MSFSRSAPTETVIAYATVTNTRRNLRALFDAGWRLLLNTEPTVNKLPPGFTFRYCIDNGAWRAHQQQQPWKREAFEELLHRAGPGADFVVVPDIVAKGHLSFLYSKEWLPEVLKHCPRALFAVQNGMTPEQVRPVLEDPRVGLFVGGDTDWKLRTLPSWCALGRETGRWVHVGRVNSRRRILACSGEGATSFDGTCASKYAVKLPLLEKARRQLGLHSPYNPEQTA